MIVLEVCVTYKKGQKVLVKTQSGSYVDAFILEPFDSGVQSVWWVEYFQSSIREVTLYEAAHLDEWNTPKAHLCICGATATQQPGHSYYCQVFT